MRLLWHVGVNASIFIIKHVSCIWVMMKKTLTSKQKEKEEMNKSKRTKNLDGLASIPFLLHVTSPPSQQ